MRLKRIRKHKKWVVLSPLICFAVYVLGCCLIPPLLKNSAWDDMEMQQTISASERVCVIDDNVDALIWRLRMIREAQKEIILVTFELRDDTSGKAVMAALLEAAERGVKVRLLVDGVDGQIQLHDSRNFEAFLSHENIDVKFYNPLHFTEFWKVNYRLHDKYLIVDDTAYLLGGRNTHDVYLGKPGEDAQADRDIVVYETSSSDGTSLDALRSYFEMVWNLEECELLSGKMTEEKQESIRKALAEHLEAQLCEYGLPMPDIDWYGETMETENITLLTGNSEPRNKAPAVWKQLCRLMGDAKEEVIILSPLVICDDAMLADLAHIGEGTANIQIITSALENNVNPLAADYPHQRMKVLETGIAISEYCGTPPLHTKTILIDDCLSVIGSYNLDARSTYIDTEIMLIIDCPALNADLRDRMDRMQEQSRTIEPDGSVTFGAGYVPKEMPFGRKCLFLLLRLILYPFQYLL